MYRIFSLNYGHSLLELMIASSLGAFVLAGMLQVTDSTKQNNRIEQAMTEIQENGRFAMNYLTNSISYRGYQGCLMPVTLSVSDEDTVDWDNAAYTEPVALNFPFANLAQSALRGYEVDEASVWTPDPDMSVQDTDIIAVKAGTGGHPVPRSGSDVISIQFASRDSLDVVSDMSTLTSDIVIGDSALNIQQNDLVFVGDCTLGDLFRVSNVPSTTPPISLEHRISHNITPALRRTYTTSAQVRTFNINTYYVADTGRTTASGDVVYALYRRDVDDNVDEIIEGVESLQIEYGEQLSTDNVRFLTADDSQLNMRRVVSVRIGILMQSLVESKTQDDANTYVLPGAVLTPDGNGLNHQGGRYHRKVFSKTIQLRNRA